MPIKVNQEIDADAILMQYQGRRIPAPTRLAVDDAENLQGGALQGGGNNASGTAGGNNLLTNLQNFTQVQEGGGGFCPAHGTMVDIWHQKGSPGVIPVQDVIKGQVLRYQFGDKLLENYVEDVDRKWCESLWVIQVGNTTLECSPTHLIITSPEDHDGTPANTLEVGQSILMRAGLGKITMSQNTNRSGWVYRIALTADGSPEAHFFMGNNIVQHNFAKPIDER